MSKSPDWYLETSGADDMVIQKYAGDSSAHGTTHDMYVAYVLVVNALNRAREASRG